MDFKETYRACVLTEGKGCTYETLGSKFIEEFRQDTKGSANDRFLRAYKKLDEVWQGCGGPMRTDLVGIVNLECFSLCNDLLRTEAGKK
ncbi:MAG: hypothetical protein AABX27_04390 [Nanoarchaeota archaeon]